VEDITITNHTALLLPNLDSSKLFESRIKSVPSNTQSNELATLMINNVDNAQNLLAKIKNKTFTVSYFDKYNQSEFSLRLMLQFIDQLKKQCNISIAELNVHLEKTAFRSTSYPEFIINNYSTIEDYEYDLKELSNNFSFKVNAKEEFRLPHYRYFQFTSTDISFTIRIDGGIAHGIKPKERLFSKEMTYDNQLFEIRKDVGYDIIFNISYEI
jgi:hypothetical protein